MAHSSNFLQGNQFKDTNPKTHVANRMRTFFVSFFIFIILWGVAFVASVVYVGAQTVSARADLFSAQESANDLAFEQASEDLERARESLGRAQRVLPIIRTASWVPVIGSRVSSVADVIDAAKNITQAMGEMFELGKDLVQLSGFSEEYLLQMNDGLTPDVTFDDLSTQTKRLILQRLSASSDELDLLVVNIDIIDEEIQLLSRDAMTAPLVDLLEPMRKRLLLMRESLGSVAVATKLLPAFGGLDEAETTLLLFLNNNELRPGGGFIGSYGVLTMDGGDIAHLDTADVYALDNAAQASVNRIPPYPLASYNATDVWFFRDSNWSPDFSVSAEKAIELFLEEVGYLDSVEGIPVAYEIDHVVGITPTFASDLLSITGDIAVGGQVFSSENVADLLEYQVEFAYAQQGIPEAQRKAILADLVQAMKTELFSLPFSRWSEVNEAVQKSLLEKQVLLYSADEDVQNIVAQIGWGGLVEEVESDVLMVVDANLASLKSDPFVDREIEYSFFENSSGQWVGRVEILYKHKGVFDWKTTRYRTYARIYVPLGAEFISASGTLANDLSKNSRGVEGSVDQYEEFGLQVFGAFTSVEPGAEQLLTFEFELSPLVVDMIEDGVYDLAILKQVGALSRALTLDLDFGKTLTDAEPSEDFKDWGNAVYSAESTLDKDLQFHVEL
jgi:hypothetical protein